MDIFPEARQLFRAKIGQHLAIGFQHRRKFLAGKADHLIKGSFIGDDINLFVVNIVVIQPPHGFVTPPTIGFDEQTWFRFHNYSFVDEANKINRHRNKISIDHFV